jgi:hypothetical protein
MPIYFPGASSLIPSNANQVIDDFHVTDNTFYNHWVVSSTGGVVSVGQGSTNNQYDIAQLTWNAAAPYFLTISRGLNQWAVPNGFWQFNFQVDFTALSSAGQTMTTRVGLGDQTLADFNNGIYFEYTNSQFGGAWACCLASGGVRTKVNSAAFVVTGNNKNSLKAYGFSPGTAIYNINGNIVAGVSTNFPAQSAALGLILQVQKTNGGGSINQAVLTDYAGLFYVPSR